MPRPSAFIHKGGSRNPFRSARWAISQSEMPPRKRDEQEEVEEVGGDTSGSEVCMHRPHATSLLE
jgi:hypothetical protein